MKAPETNDFIFSPRYRVWRHVVYWAFHTCIWAGFWVLMGISIPYERQLLYMTLWIPAFILFGYPLIYGAVPHLLLKGKMLAFFITVLAWAAVGLFIDEYYRAFVIIPFQKALALDRPIPGGPMASCYLCMTTSAATPMIIKFFKLWTVKQQAWVQAQQEKITAELQLLKAQLHPHFLFNTLNNIYSFALDNSPKTPQMILRLSSLLSYMLYDCKAGEVLLEKELDIMRNYIDLEKERYGDKIDISVNIEGDIRDKYIAPLLILPFLENAFKHGTSEQLENPWMSVDIAVKDYSLRCKVVNSKNAVVPFHENGVGINNIKKRLELLYPGQYELKLADEREFFVVSFLLELQRPVVESLAPERKTTYDYVPETPMPAYR